VLTAGNIGDNLNGTYIFTKSLFSISFFLLKVGSAGYRPVSKLYNPAALEESTYNLRPPCNDLLQCRHCASQAGGALASSSPQVLAVCLAADKALPSRGSRAGGGARAGGRGWGGVAPFRCALGETRAGAGTAVAILPPLVSHLVNKPSLICAGVLAAGLPAGDFPP